MGETIPQVKMPQVTMPQVTMPQVTTPQVILQLPDGTRSAPIPDPRLAAGAVQIAFPKGWAGRILDCCIHPLADAHTAAADRADWQLRLPVDQTGHAHLANMLLGRYSLHAVMVEAGRVRIASGDVELQSDLGPARVDLAEVPGATR
jgi:hypothetical protein